MPDSAPRKSFGGYTIGEEYTYAEALEDSLAFRKAADALPGNIAYEEAKRYRREALEPVVYGPPSPFALRGARPRMKG